MKPTEKHVLKDSDENKHFQGDGLRLLFLTLLYSVQGFAFGFLDTTMPVILKKHFSYTEIGIISWGGLPYTIKFLFAPFVDAHFIKWLGKKRSWIIPTQILLAIINFYIASHLTQLIKERRYLLITFLFFFILLFGALQDIAIDGWCLTMVKECNKDNASLTQTIGIEAGVFMSTTCYFAFNSLTFCNSYIYSFSQGQPIIDESSFFLYWGCFILIMTVITTIFGNEKHDRIKVEEHGLTVNELLDTVKWSFKSKQIIFFIFFCLSLKSFGSVNSFVGKIYLLDELKYSQSKYSFISLLGFPVTLLSSILIIKLGKRFKILHKLVIVGALKAISDIITINILYYFYSPGLTFDIFLILSNWFNIFTSITWHTLIVNYANTIANPIIASTQFTFVASLSNLGEDFPRIYTYSIIDLLGVFIPNLIGGIITIFICAWFYLKTNDPDLYKVMEISNLKEKSK